ncbi:MAG: DnaJ domain-containing protein [Candidatus Paceibacterota bacterium]
MKMKFESADKDSQFYSTDPYTVLGVAKEATSDEIKKAWKSLLMDIHPDTSSDPKATEKSQNINVAYDILTGKGGNLGGHTSRPGQQERHNPYSSQSKPDQEHHKKTKQHKTSHDQPKNETKEEEFSQFESNIFKALRTGVDGAYGFRNWLKQAKTNDLKEDRINELFQTEEAKDILKENFLHELMNRSRHDSGPDNILRYIKKWDEVGIKLENLFNLPQTKKYLEDSAKYEIIKPLTDTPDSFLRFVEKWKKASIDLSYVINLPEIKKHLEDYIKDEKIKPLTDTPDEFLRFVEKWKRAGVDLSYVINLPEIKKRLEDSAKYEITKPLTDTPDSFLRFVKKWKRAGLDLSYVINLPDVHKYLEDTYTGMDLHNNMKAKKIIKKWTDAGFDLTQRS